MQISATSQGSSENLGMKKKDRFMGVCKQYEINRRMIPEAQRQSNWMLNSSFRDLKNVFPPFDDQLLSGLEFTPVHHYSMSENLEYITNGLALRMIIHENSTQKLLGLIFHN